MRIVRASGIEVPGQSGFLLLTPAVPIVLSGDEHRPGRFHKHSAHLHRDARELGASPETGPVHKRVVLPLRQT